VKRSTTSGGPYTNLATGIAGTTYTDTSAANGTTYFYVVTAVGAGGESGNSNEASATPTAPLAAPAAPTNLVGTTASRTQINLTWADNSTNESGFRIERSPDGTTYVQIDTVAANVRSYASTGLQANKNYRFRVRAFNGAGNSAYSNVATAKTLK
jgi:fibronectin type 3 domain-containing protein